MKFPWVNILILVLLVLQTLTGYLGLTNGRAANAWTLWLHGIIAYTIVLLLFFKSAVILDAWRRKKSWTTKRIGFLLTLILLLLVLVSGLLWTFDGPIYLGGFSLVSLHIYIAVPLMILMLWHSWHMRFIRRVEHAAGRRLFFSGLTAAVSGFLLWAMTGRLKAWRGLDGAYRRFTGSYEIGSFTPNFPVVSWIADRPPAVSPASWVLRIEGEVESPLSLSYDVLMASPISIERAVLDCTGGWYSQQSWQGIRIADLLERAGVKSSAQSVTFEAVSGYRRRFDVAEAKGFLLALGTLPVGRQGTVELFRPLDHGHGFPARLVAPGRRGMEWVKWVTLIRVNDTGPNLQSPLPLS